MTYKELYKALTRLGVETGSLSCLGCEYESNCSLAGCAIIRAAQTLIRLLRTENQRLFAALEKAQNINNKRERDDFESNGDM